jgi:hypothetical protein
VAVAGGVVLVFEHGHHRPRREVRTARVEGPAYFGLGSFDPGTGPRGDTCWIR